MGDVPIVNNCSTCISIKRQWELYPKFWGFFIEGVLLAVSNLLIVAAIARQQELRRRKEYVIIAGLALIDGINGLATGMAGLARVIYIQAGTANEPRSRWQCFWSPWIQLFHWADPLTCIMLLVVSIDRLIAVTKPVRYFKYTTIYARKLVGSAYLFTFFNILWAGAVTYKHQEVIYPKLCMSGWSYDQIYYFYLIYLRLVTAGLSIFVYVLVFYFYKQRMSKISPNGAKDKKQMTDQRRMTVTLGISCCTNNLNGIVNFFLYTTRHREVRLAVKYLVMCKDMPPLESLAKSTSNRNAKTSKRNEA